MKNCKTCRWFAPDKTGRRGRCERPGVPSHPLIAADDGCGEHKRPAPKRKAKG